MSTSFYIYEADDGTDYQVLLDDEIASEVGFTPSPGGLPVLPDMITPRYATLRRIVGSVITTIPVPFPTVASFAIAIGTTMFLGGLQYTVAALQGQEAAPNPFIGTVGPTGPTGPAGPPGTFTSYNGGLASVLNLNNAGIYFDAVTLALPAGTYLFTGFATFETGAAASEFIARVTASGGVGDLANSQVYMATATRPTAVHVSGIAVLATAQNLRLQCNSSATTGKALAVTGSNTSGKATQLTALKIA